MKVALVYDRINKIGGAERILTALHSLFPDAPLYTQVYDRERAPWANDWVVKTSFLNSIPQARRYHEFFPVFPVFAFESFDFSGFDVVISITTGEAKGVITGPGTLHIAYILTPTRYLWSHYDTYFSKPFFRFLSFPVVILLRLWDQMAAQRPDLLLTISKTAQARINKYYHRESTVIYPPVDTDKFRTQNEELSIEERDYFLVISRLVKYKRIDIAIESCNRLRWPLKIIGEGMEKHNLQKISGPSVEFLGNLTDSELSHYYRNCRALIVPQEEDFGLVMVEALSCGAPVVAYAGGGAAEIVVSGKNGELFSPQNKDALTEILEKFTKNTYSRDFCRKSVQRFNLGEFNKSFIGFVGNAWEKSKKEKLV